MLILFHSGSGSTNMIASLLRDLLKKDVQPDIQRINPDFDYTQLNNHEVIIIGFPVYHFTVSTSMRRFLEKMPVFADRKKVFLFATYAMATGNAIRNAGLILKEKNVDFN